MRIRARILWSVGVAAVIAVATSAVLYLGLGSVQAAIERNDAVAGSLNQIFELSVLTTDYLVYYEPRAERQWLQSHARLGVLLGELGVESDEEIKILTRVRENHTEARRLFVEITDAHKAGEAGEVAAEVSRESEVRLAARLLIVMQSMVSDAVRLGEYSSAAALEAQRISATSVMVIALGAIAVMVGIGLSTLRTVVLPMEQLKASMDRVGAGDLNARSGVMSPDEVGDLAVAFDAMVADLQRSYERLEREIAERRRAEEELSGYRDHLERIVDERTEELLHLNEDLTAATRAKDDFLASMSHELRTPLNSIIGFTEIMLKGLAGEVNDEQRRQLTMVHESGQQLLMLVNDVLDLARINAGQMTLDIQPISLAQTVNRLAEMMQPATLAKGLTLTCDFDEGAPATITSDRGKIDQIVLNLLSNAVKFTDAGEVSITVRPAEPGAVAIDVSDTGIGIPSAELTAVFEQFHRAHRDLAATHPGTGLGLSISRRLAETLGGRLAVTSDPGVGSTFTLVLPLVTNGRTGTADLQEKD